jgi:hypothetical protein
LIEDQKQRKKSRIKATNSPNKHEQEQLYEKKKMELAAPEGIEQSLR